MDQYDRNFKVQQLIGSIDDDKATGTGKSNKGSSQSTRSTRSNRSTRSSRSVKKQLSDLFTKK
jgi:hypothetical protein